MSQSADQDQDKTKWNADLTEAQLYAGRAVDRDFYLDMISAITKPEMAKGYRMWMNGTVPSTHDLNLGG